MAMNKAEKARMEELETALALHWPAYPAPEPMTREEIEADKVTVKAADTSVYRSREVCFGWFYNAHTSQVCEGWSSGMTHNPRGRDINSASQNMGQMYRTQREAAMAMRLEMSRKFAADLARVDRLIRGDA